jgi:hypothetical protein
MIGKAFKMEHPNLLSSKQIANKNSFAEAASHGAFFFILLHLFPSKHEKRICSSVSNAVQELILS